jgi:carbonic anhydrase
MKKRINFISFKTIFIVIIFFFYFNASWEYQGQNGPQNWGNLSEEYKFCKIGYNQSPIDILDNFSENDLKFFYKNEEIEKHQETHFTVIDFGENNFLLRRKKKFFLRKMFIRHPSEHLIKSNQFPLEIQIAHKSDDEQWLFLGIFVEIGEENQEFNQLISLLENNQNNAVTKFNLAKIIKEKDQIFFYEGSQTNPPCKEGIKWYIFKTPIKISKTQMNKIIQLAIASKTNSRPTQKFNPEVY